MLTLKVPTNLKSHRQPILSQGFSQSYIGVNFDYQIDESLLRTRFARPSSKGYEPFAIQTEML